MGSPTSQLERRGIEGFSINFPSVIMKINSQQPQGRYQGENKK
jgi:hypothetical protein